jgi:UDP-N-acetylmuramoyl-L-alanyl-D-glutamate--2,6-diaminopimelate ligase
MKFSEVLAGLSVTKRLGADPEIQSITADSREVAAGGLFVAVPGYASDGHRYLDQALARGAAALLLQSGRVSEDHLAPVAAAVVPDTRSALAAAAANFYRHPAAQLRIIGVTGTDGKTTTCYLINAVLEGAGRRTGLIGTVDYKIGERWESNPTRLTTPGAPEVQGMLRAMADSGADCAILESTSHGLELRRLDQCEYDVAVFTNLSPDHLDQHKTMDAYRAAKGRLFQFLDEPTGKSAPRYAVINLDDPEYAYFRGLTSKPAFSYGFKSGADVLAEAVDLLPTASRFRVRTPAGTFQLALPMPGLFNVSNALAAIAVGVGEGIETDSIKQSLEGFEGVPGRMESINCGQAFSVVVDYAHTGEALRNVLKTLRAATGGRIIAVFGSAGERGHTRRKGMASAAAELADYIILTDEDPRSEDPEAIIEEMAGALRAAGRAEPADFLRVLDRQEAIRAAIERAGPEDLVLLAGKGHEQSIEGIGGRAPWDDRVAARRALAERGYEKRK